MKKNKKLRLLFVICIILFPTILLALLTLVSLNILGIMKNEEILFNLIIILMSTILSFITNIIAIFTLKYNWEVFVVEQEERKFKEKEIENKVKNSIDLYEVKTFRSMVPKPKTIKNVLCNKKEQKNNLKIELKFANDETCKIDKIKINSLKIIICSTKKEDRGKNIGFELNSENNGDIKIFDNKITKTIITDICDNEYKRLLAWGDHNKCELILIADFTLLLINENKINYSITKRYFIDTFRQKDLYFKFYNKTIK